MADKKVKLTSLPTLNTIGNDSNLLINQAGNDFKVSANKFAQTSNNLSDVDPEIARNNIGAISRDEANELSEVQTFYITPEDPDGTIAGLAGTPSGEVFKVPQGMESGLSFIFYRNDGGVAVAIAAQGGDPSKNDTLIYEVSKKSLEISSDSLDHSGYVEYVGGNINIPIYIDSEGRVITEFDLKAEKFVGGLLSEDDISVSMSDSGMLSYKGESKIIPTHIDDQNKVVSGFDTVTERFVGGFLTEGMISSEMSDSGIISYTGEGLKYPIIVDDQNRTLLEWDVSKDCLVGVFEENKNEVNRFKELNHFISYGQSLSLGVQGRPIISTTQPFRNVKFVGGVRGNGDFSSTTPLIEDLINLQVPSHSGGETPCSGTANYASILAWKLSGINPQSSIILASAPGRGARQITELNKGSEQYDQYLLEHITGGKLLNESYALQAIGWLQGETDLDLGHTYETYKPLYDQIIKDINNDARSISGQEFDVAFISYQLSYKTLISNAVSRTQFDAFKDRRAYLSCPMYRFTPNTDRIHTTNVMYKLIGAYQGRVYHQIVVEKRSPDWLEPISATISGDVVSVKFSVPTMPIMFNVDDLPITQDYGFAVVDVSGNKATISEIVASGDSVFITLPAGFEASFVRYGYDYAPAVNFVSASGGNLTDSTSEEVSIDGAKYKMFHCCPHFEFEIVKDII